MIDIKCRKIVGGRITGGNVLITKNPINMLAMIDTKSGEINDEKHDLFRQTLKDRILIFPNAVGSSVGAYVFYSLKINAANPRAVICSEKCDTITASGCAIADIPLVDKLETNIHDNITKNSYIVVDADHQIIRVKQFN